MAAAASTSSTGRLKIAVEGCCHGNLDQIYQKLAEEEKSAGSKVFIVASCHCFLLLLVL